MRTIVLFAIVLFAGFTATAGDKDKPVDLTGNWKETQRMNKGKLNVDYTDTIRIEFMIGNEFLWQKPGTFMLKGTYKATESSLDLGSRFFTIVEYSKRKIVLKDDDGFYQFNRYEKKEVTEDNSNAGSSGRGAQPTTGNVNMSDLNGDWETYKRTSKVKLNTVDQKFILKKLSIKVKGGKVQGNMHPADESNGSIIWTIDRYEDGIIYFNGKESRSMKVLKCADGELILEELSYTYFLKKY